VDDVAQCVDAQLRTEGLRGAGTETRRRAGRSSPHSLTAFKFGGDVTHRVQSNPLGHVWKKPLEGF